MSIERDTPMLYDTAGGTQAVKAQTQTHKYKCAITVKQTLTDTRACKLAQTLLAKDTGNDLITCKFHHW